MTQAITLPKSKGAFTLIEFLAVVGMLALGALMLAPVFARTRTDSPTLRCTNNLRQLQRALLMYAADNGGYLAPNPGSFTYTTNAWCTGVLDWTTGVGGLPGYPNPNTNTYYLVNALLGPYVGRDANYYKCPADRVPSVIGPRVRSYSMNGFLGGTVELSSYDYTGYRIFLKDADFIAPGAAQTFVFIDEHADSINDALLGVRMPASWPAATYWDDVPASVHNGSGVLSFADGHVECHPWLDPNTKAPVRKANGCSATGLTSVHDNAWLVARASAPR